jgi:hypothetical protein
MAEQSLQIRDHRAAVALNNMGVFLLERRAYRQGMETLKDAIFVMKRVFRPRSTSEESTCSAEAKVHRAVRRMANPQPVPSAVAIDVISHGGATSHPSSLASILRGSSSAAFTFPIRIEATDLDSPEDRDPDLESSIMLYNFALGHLCMAKVAKSPTKLQEGALKLFNMAYSIISNQNGLSRLSEGEMRRIRETRLLLSVVVMSNVVRVFSEMGRNTEADESYQRLVRLGTVINEMEMDEPDPLEGQIAAAAAA